jgi:hypothetical protein
MGKQLVNFITCGCESSAPFLVTRRVLIEEQELPTLPEHMSSQPVLVEFVLLDLCLSVLCFLDLVVVFRLTIVLSGLSVDLWLND